MGYGASTGEAIEFPGPRCDGRDFHENGVILVDQMTAVLDKLRQNRRLNMKTVIGVGQSYGGYGRLALSTQSLEGLKAVVLFAPVAGSNERGTLCNPVELFRAVSRFGKDNRVPMLWIVSENDQWATPEIVRNMHREFTGAGGKAELFFAPPSGEDGHGLYARRGDVVHWGATLDKFLRAQGLPTWAPDALNLGKFKVGSKVREGFQKYLAISGEKAFALSPDGYYGYSFGMPSTEGARKRALKSCIKVKPISQLRAQAPEVIRELGERREPVIITVHGKAKAVLQDIASYEQTQDTLALLKILALGNKSVEEGKVRPAREAFARIRRRVKR